ncbi:hypothetical protein GCM10029992_26290 [Glycomyces albus]
METTDWPQIVALYNLLHRVSPSPVIALNRAVAVGMASGPGAGLTLLDELADDGALEHYHLFHSARAGLLERLGRRSEAARAYRRALAEVGNEPERDFLRQRLAAVETDRADGTR